MTRRPAPKQTEDIADQPLAALGLDELRQTWRRRYGRPPSIRSAEFLRLMLAWRIQADAAGGLSAKTRRQLRGGKSAPKPTAAMGAGAKITREWQGRRIEVVVTTDGFVWGGQTYASLSAVARAITGVRWNGPRFFGLRDAA
jgi:hypothetical protein